MSAIPATQLIGLPLRSENKITHPFRGVCLLRRDYAELVFGRKFVLDGNLSTLIPCDELPPGFSSSLCNVKNFVVRNVLLPLGYFSVLFWSVQENISVLPTSSSGVMTGLQFILPCFFAGKIYTIRNTLITSWHIEDWVRPQIRIKSLKAKNRV